MFFGHGNIDGIDFWGEAAFPNTAMTRFLDARHLASWNEIQGGADSGVLRAAFELAGPAAG